MRTNFRDTDRIFNFAGMSLSQIKRPKRHAARQTHLYLKGKFLEVMERLYSTEMKETVQNQDSWVVRGNKRDKAYLSVQYPLIHARIVLEGSPPKYLQQWVFDTEGTISLAANTSLAIDIHWDKDTPYLVLGCRETAQQWKSEESKDGCTTLRWNHDPVKKYIGYTGHECRLTSGNPLQTSIKWNKERP